MRFQAPESLAEQIAQHLGKLIITGQLKPRDRIQELKVAGELDVSRGSVREALLILERRHVIEIYPRKGAVVTDLTEAHIQSIYDMAACLVSMLAVKYAKRWQPADLAPVNRQTDAILKLMADRESRAEAIVEACLDLLRLCYPVVDNPYLEETLENCRPAISRTYYLAMKSQVGAVHQSRHFVEKLIVAVRERRIADIPSLVEQFAENQKQLAVASLASQSDA
jgi:DNA-binding GntR family transcriptional regulator